MENDWNLTAALAVMVVFMVLANVIVNRMVRKAEALHKQKQQKNEHRT